MIPTGPYTNQGRELESFYKRVCHSRRRCLTPSDLLTYSLTAWSRVLLEKITVSQLAKKFTGLYGTRTFITAFISSRSLSVSRPPQFSPCSLYHFLKIHSNIILSFKYGSSKWSLSLRIPHQTLYTSIQFPYVLHVPPNSFFLI